MNQFIKLFFLASFFVAGALTASAAASLQLTGPVVDPAGLLSPAGEAEVRASAEAFRKATGRWLVMVVLPDRASFDPAGIADTVQAPWEPAGSRTPIGIAYISFRSDPVGTLLVIDPDWRRVAHQQWIPMFPQRLAQKYGDEPFERRVALSAQYFANVFPDKIAFLMQPPDVIGRESVEAAEKIMTAVKWFIYFIILFTFFRTIWPARLREEDTDAFSEELRRLKKERQIW